MAILNGRARALATLVGVALIFGSVGVIGGSAGAAVPGASTALSGTCSHVPALERSLIHGRLTACGKSLIDASGHRVRLRAYEFTGMLPGNGDSTNACLHWYAPPSSMAATLRRQGFNSIFIMLSWANLEPTPPTKLANGTVVHHWNRDYLKALDTAINGFASQGIAVVLALAQWKWSPAFTNIDLGGGHSTPCGQGMPMWLYPHGGGVNEMAQAEYRFYTKGGRARAGYLNAWRLISRRYAKTTTVVGFVLFWEAYDLIAQPYLHGHTVKPSALHLTHWYETIGAAIHRFEPHQLLIAPDWQSRQKFFALQGRPRLSNLVLAFEYYTYRYDQAARTRLAAYLRRAQAWHSPAWIAEFNAFGHATSVYGTQQDPNWQQDTDSLLAHAKKVRLGWAIFGTVDSALAKILRQNK